MSLDKIGLSLFDFLGYILPGYLALLALSVVEASFASSSVLSLKSISGNVLSSAIVAYFLGQLCHRIGSWIKTRRYKWFQSKEMRLSGPVYYHARTLLQSAYGFNPDDEFEPDSLETYAMADSYLVAAGQTSERDSLITREGFHKTSMVAFALMAVVFLSTLVKGGAAIQMGAGVHSQLGCWTTAVLAIVMIFACLVFRGGFVFYNRMKISNTILIFIALYERRSMEKRSGK